MSESTVAKERQFVITRNQFEKLKEVFYTNDSVNYIVWKESSPSGIGPTVSIEFDSKETIKLDITDIESW